MGTGKAITADLATERGLHLSQDHRLRRELLQQLYGYGVIQKASLEKRDFGMAFDAYFADELLRLADLVSQGFSGAQVQ